MNKKLEVFEHFKTAILVVLFLITILLLYLSYIQAGESKVSSEILPGGYSAAASVNIDEYIIPSYSVKSNGKGRYLLTNRNQKEAFATASECASSLLSSSNMSIKEITEEEYEAICMEESSIQLIFEYDIPFDDYCRKITGKVIESEEKIDGFRAVLFSNVIKSDLYLRNMAGNCYKISVAENYYSTEALSQVLVFDGGEIGFMDLYMLSFKSVSAKTEIDLDSVPERIFGETLDFVRKITDGQGNATYMYGYGQRRLSAFADGSFEYKEDVSGENNPDFFSDLAIALRFAKGILGVDLDKISLIEEQHVNDGNSEINGFRFEIGDYNVYAEVTASMISFFKLEYNQGSGSAALK